MSGWAVLAVRPRLTGTLVQTTVCWGRQPGLRSVCLLAEKGKKLLLTAMARAQAAAAKQPNTCHKLLGYVCSGAPIRSTRTCLEKYPVIASHRHDATVLSHFTRFTNSVSKVRVFFEGNFFQKFYFSFLLQYWRQKSIRNPNASIHACTA